MRAAPCYPADVRLAVSSFTECSGRRGGSGGRRSFFIAIGGPSLSGRSLWVWLERAPARGVHIGSTRLSRLTKIKAPLKITFSRDRIYESKVSFVRWIDEMSKSLRITIA